MRALSRVALVVIVALSASFPLLADHLQGDCPLRLVASNPPSEIFRFSPHGVFRDGNQVFALRGQTLTTFAVTDLGDMQIVREDFIGSLAARETVGGITFHNGHLFISSEAGLEIFDLRNVRAGGSAPVLVSRTAGLHYRELAGSGSLLAAVFPASDLPCAPNGTSFCTNTIDIFSIANLSAPVRVGTITAGALLGFNDVIFNQGFLYAATEIGVQGFNVSNPLAPVNLAFIGGRRTTFLVGNGTNILGVGNEGSIELFRVGLNGSLTRFAIYNLPFLTIDRANPIMFHPQAYLDDQGGRLITLIDEMDPHTLEPARTIAFDVFDLSVPMYEGAFQRGYEDISMVTPDEIKHNPVAVGSLVYTIGELNGVQTWGACGVATGRFEWDGLQSLVCGGAEIKGWVTGRNRIANVEIFLGNSSLGPATISGIPRLDVSSRTPVFTFRLTDVNLDATVRGEQTLRAIATDALGVRRQFASERIFFTGPGTNCRQRSVRR